jgi:hypothetical protein
MLILLFSVGVSKIDIGAKNTDHMFKPVGFFQKREHLSARLSPVLLQLQLPPDTVFLPIFVLFGLALQAFIINA